MPPETKLSGNTDGKCSSSLASDYISWACSTTKRSCIILQSYNCSMAYTSLAVSDTPNLASNASNMALPLSSDIYESTIAKNPENSRLKKSIDFLKSFLLGRSKLSLRFALSGVIVVQKPDFIRHILKCIPSKGAGLKAAPKPFGVNCL